MTQTMTRPAKKTQSELLERLRAIVRPRPLRPNEALHVAERQAALLLASLGVGRPPIPLSVLAELPFITIELRAGLPASGMATLTDSGWVIALNGDEPEYRQAYSLCHEIKHVIDDPIARRLYPSMGGYSAHERAEWICNYFAACLLMPKKHIIHDWCSGLQNIRRLAVRYRVSQAAMNIRLSQLGLLADIPRCAVVSQGALA